MLAIIEIFLELILEVFLEGVICTVFCLIGDALASLIEKISDTAETVSDAVETATDSANVGCGLIFLLLVMGGAAGWAMSMVFPEKIFTTIPITGISLLVTPLAMGGFMSALGAWKAGQDEPASFFATFLGGALFGFAAAGTRLAIIASA